jgi:hypothetical protein
MGPTAGVYVFDVDKNLSALPGIGTIYWSSSPPVIVPIELFQFPPYPVTI